MAAFAISFTAVENDEGLITFTDTSNWGGANDQGYDKQDFVRILQLTDAYGTIVGILTFDPTSLTVTYQLIGNKWIVAVFTISGVQGYTLTQKYGFQRIYEVAYNDALISLCGCDHKKTGINFCLVDAFYQGAAFAVPIGDGVSYQKDIDLAYNLLT